MSYSELFNRRAALLSLLALGGCGFRPAFGPEGNAGGLLANILVAAPTDETSFVFVAHLESRLGQAATPDYELSYTISVEEVEVGIDANQETTRFNVVGQIDFALRRIGTDDLAKSGRVEGFSSYSATTSTLSVAVARRDAVERLMISLADQIFAVLTATAGEWTA